MWIRLIIFLILNFAALGIGSIFTGPGVSSEWYQSLNQAPWLPPGWTFGAAWTTIMLLFSVYLSKLWPQLSNKKEFLIAYTFQWILNVGWNVVFFKFHLVLIGLLVILLLTLLIAWFLIRYKEVQKLYSYLILPYFMWLCVASSLNTYIFFYN
jgi:tryptophan-rich sensory protein